MAYHIDGSDIVIDGWEQGISDNPYKGINDMRGVNIVSVPGEASVSFAPVSNSFPSCEAQVISADPSTDIVTVTLTTGSIDTSSGQAVYFIGSSLPVGITAGQTYWLIPKSTNTFILANYWQLPISSQVNITSTGTGTMVSIDMDKIKFFDKTTGVALDASGRAWDTQYAANSGGYKYHYIGNDITTTNLNTNGNGLIYYRGYLFLFYNSRICYLAYSPGGIVAGSSWQNAWNPLTGGLDNTVDVFNSSNTAYYSHETILANDQDLVYICDTVYLVAFGKVLNNAVTFDPTNPATYTWIKQVMSLPFNEQAICLEQLGSSILIGGIYNLLYSWNQIDPSPTTPLKISDNYIYHLMTVNTNTYIFAGRRGRIFVTSGTQAQEYIKMPDHISGGIDPIYLWGNCAYNKNQLYFGVIATNNDKTALTAPTNYSGMWAVDITTDGLRVATLQTNTSATVDAIYAASGAQSGFGTQTAWTDGTSHGVDTTTSVPYTSYNSYIETDIIPVGQFLNKKTFENVEFKLSFPLVSGEGIKISYRTNRSQSYNLVGETTTAGTISDFYTVNFDQVQWIQFKIEMKSTTTTPSYVRLTELRLRSYTGQSMINANL